MSQHCRRDALAIEVDTISIYDAESSKPKKKLLVVITVFLSTGSIMVQGQGHTVWKIIEAPTLLQITDKTMNIDEKVVEFAETLKNQAQTDQIPANGDFGNTALPTALPVTKETENATVSPHANDSNATKTTNSEATNLKHEREMDLYEKLKNEKQSILHDQNSKIESMQLEINHLTKSNADLKAEVVTLTALTNEMRNELTKIQEASNKNKEKHSQNIQTLSKKLVEMKSTTSNLEQVNERIKLELHGHIEKHNDAVFCEKTGERLSQKQINGLQEDIFVLGEKMEKSLKELENFKKQTHDKINHINQTFRSRHTENDTSLASRNSETSGRNDTDPVNDTADSCKETTGSQRQSTSPVDIENKQTLVIGDSIIKNMTSRKFDKKGRTYIKSIRGGKIGHIKNFLMTVKASQLKVIIIHAGTNHLRDETTDEILLQIKDLVLKMKNKFPQVKICISSLLHRETKEGNEAFVNKINEVNRNLKILCENIGASLILNDNLNDPSYRSDGLHLSFKGTMALARNFKSSAWSFYKPRKENGEKKDSRVHEPESEIVINRLDQRDSLGNNARTKIPVAAQEAIANELPNQGNYASMPYMRQTFPGVTQPQAWPFVQPTQQQLYSPYFQPYMARGPSGLQSYPFQGHFY